MRERLCIAFIVLITSARIAGAGPALSATRKAGGAVLDEIRLEDAAVGQQIHDAYRTEQPVFIFVPGILGSKLVAPNGSVLWGRLNFDRRNLQYPSPATPEFLDTFAIFGYSSDIYGRFRTTVEAMDISDVTHLLTFPYDWRADLRTTASDFDARLRGDWAPLLKGRRIVIVAHSMGGLMIDWWYKKLYSKSKASDYAFRDIENFVFLGTPHQGATSALLSIIAGYQPPDPGAFESAVYARMFHDLNSAAATFPSLYEMFPSQGAVTEDATTGHSPVDHFSVTAWNRYGWGGAPADIHDKYYDRLKKNLDSGRAFRKDLEEGPCLPNAVYFYGSAFRTATSITMRSSRGKFKAQANFPPHSGDGRVPTKSAQNFGGCITSPVQLRPDSEEHGALANDSAFIDFLVLLRDISMRSADAKVVSLVKDRSELISLMADRGVLLPVPLNRAQRKSDEAQAITALNREIVRRAEGTNDEARAAYRSARRLDRANEPDSAAQLYAVALSLNADSPLTQHAANNLGLLLLNGGAPGAAIANLQLAVTRTPIADTKVLRDVLLAASEDNLGVAYARTGDQSKAVTAWSKAAKLDATSPAVDHLKRAEHRKSE